MTCVRVGDLGLPLLLSDWPLWEINTSGPPPMRFVNEINPLKSRLLKSK